MAATEDEVVKQLGSPRGRTAHEAALGHELVTLHYNWLDIVLSDGRLYQVKVVFPLRGKPPIREIAWLKRISSWRKGDFVRFVRQEGIECRMVLFGNDRPEDGTPIEVESSGVWAVFNPPPIERIHALYSTPARPGRFRYAAL